MISGETMTGQTKVTGMVLASMPVGDYDRRLTILTKERGKIAAFAKGARKPTSTLLACSQPFSFGEFELYEGKSSYNVMNGEISNYFSELRDDIEAIYYGMYFCEFACYMTKENLDATEQLKLLYVSLRALCKKSLNKKLVRYIFELRFLSVSGEMPQVFECVSCGKKDLLEAERVWFLAEKGGLFCEECQGSVTKEAEGQWAHASDKIEVGSSTVYTLQYMVSAPLEKLYTFTVSEEVLDELGRVCGSFLQKQVGREMKTEEMLKCLDFS